MEVEAYGARIVYKRFCPQEFITDDANEQGIAPGRTAKLPLHLVLIEAAQSLGPVRQVKRPQLQFNRRCFRESLRAACHVFPCALRDIKTRQPH